MLYPTDNQISLSYVLQQEKKVKSRPEEWIVFVRFSVYLHSLYMHLIFHALSSFAAGKTRFSLARFVVVAVARIDWTRSWLHFLSSAVVVACAYYKLQWVLYALGCRYRFTDKHMLLHLYTWECTLYAIRRNEIVLIKKLTHFFFRTTTSKNHKKRVSTELQWMKTERSIEMSSRPKWKSY